MTEVDWQLDVPLPAQGPGSHLDSYKSFYSPDASGNHTALRLHPNGLCVVTLAPTHAALLGDSGGGAAACGTDAAAQPSSHAAQEEGQQAAAATAAAAQQQGEARLALSPKLLQAEFRKGRGPLLQPESILGRLSVGGREFVLRCGVRGLLVEVNSRLQELQGAALLGELGRTYLAILDVRAAEAAQLAGRCLSEEQYRQQQRAQQEQQQPGEQEQQQPGEQQPAQQQPQQQQPQQQPNRSK